MNPEERFNPHIEGESDKDEKEDEKSAVDKEALEFAQNFIEKHGNFIKGYVGASGMEFTFKPGGFYIDLEKPAINIDPKFHLELGLNESEVLYGVLHEISHFLDMARDPDAYNSNFTRVKAETDIHKAYPKALFRLINCADDVLVNHMVEGSWKKGRQLRDPIYKKLFKSNDFQGDPFHRQFMYALLRKAMLGQEEVLVDEPVEDAIKEFKSKYRGKDFLEHLTEVKRTGEPKMSVAERFLLMQSFLEPIFKELYIKDLENKKIEDEKDGKGEKGGGDGEEVDEDPFGEDENKNATPDQSDLDDMLDKARKYSKAKKEKIIEEVYGVSAADKQNYDRDYKKVEASIKELSQVWDDIIQERISSKRILRKPSKDGPVLNPARLASGIAEIKAGILDPVIMKGYETIEVIEKHPNQIEVTLVCDGSGSMQGSKAVMQRRLAVLVTESLADFNRRVQNKKAAGKDINLVIKSEVRKFSDIDEVLKSLSDSLTYEERVRMRKGLNFINGGNNEPATFNAIKNEQFHQKTVKALRNNDLKKVIIFLTDGETNEDEIKRDMKELMDIVGEKGQDNLVIAGIGFDGGLKAKETYAPNGYYAESIEDTPNVVKQVLANLLT